MLRSIKYGLHGAVLAGLIAAPVAWNAVDKTVHLVVDGSSTSVDTTASDVADVLSGEGLRVGAHDIVAPSLTSSVRDGMNVVVRRGRLLQLDVDGRRKQVWTTAPTVAAALHQLGYSSDAFVSVSRSRRLPLSPTALAIRSPQTVTVVHDGKRDEVSTTDVTVGQVLSALHIRVGRTDQLTPVASATVHKGATITLKRVVSKRFILSRPVPYAVSRIKDTASDLGTTHVVRQGLTGQNDITYSVVYVDGKPIGTTRIASKRVLQPRTEIIAVGTRSNLQGESGVPAYKATNQAIAARLLVARGWGTQGEFDCLIQMWDRESQWRTDATNPDGGAYGIPQALPGDKLATAGPNWQTSAETQIKWGLQYIASRYGTPCGAWGWWQAHNWY